MIAFHIRKDAQDWFKKIRKELDAQAGNAGNMSMYYYCAIVGLGTKTQNFNVKSDQLASLVRHFPQQFEGNVRIIIAALLATEIENQGLRLDAAKRDQVQTYIRQFIQPESPYLTADGVKKLDSFAHGGFDILRDEMDAPETLEGFLKSLSELLCPEGTKT